MPDTAAVRLAQFSFAIKPTGETRPTPVTATRRRPRPSSRDAGFADTRSRKPGSGGLGVRFDGGYRVLDLLDRLGVLVRDLDAERLLEGHDELDRVERVRTEVVHERGLGLHFVRLDAELLHDDALDLFFHRIRHRDPPKIFVLLRDRHSEGCRDQNSSVRSLSDVCLLYTSPSPR